MKITNRKTELIEEEITLPAYRKSEFHLYLAISETEVVRVSNNEILNENKIEVLNCSASAYLSNTEPCSPDEFQQRLQSVLNMIDKFKETLMF